MPIDLVSESIKNLRREGLRTFLTLIGVVIGIAAIVSMVSIGAGLGVAVEQQLDSLGAETILVIPAGIQNIRTTLTDNDIDRLKGISGVDNVAPIYSESAVMEFNGEKISVSISATSAEDAEIFDDTGFFDVSEGRDFERNESTAILIGNEIANNYFEKKINVRKQILVNGEPYKVIGILAPQAQSFGGGPDTGNSVFMSLDGLQRITSTTEPSIIFVTALDKESINETSDDIKDYFENKYGEGSVIVYTTDEILEQVNLLLGVITIFIMGIASISLIVGGIGIMNAMVTSVLERTKEIGLYKAIGASNTKVLSIFLLEAAFIGLIGGIIGILIGLGLASLIAIVGSVLNYALVAVVTPEIVLGGLGFSIIIGMVSGFYPALRASRLDPVEALRYE
ncbi:MAG: FtsX-like permease family protein [Candidatus Diapherotrites archaeon]|jgi:putative ABC transport system permease protein|uniref:FtsX-like permease family protein n=1 Tax=Candidatus Iainarchaeum sp. TaxID=3101447 RepID=A0A8T5GFD3_9ARCH|nr:FtsX-like permease family protein [Candidatus Diapherotrites archaeon]